MSTTPPADRPTFRAWMLLAFLTALNVLNFVDRQLIASLAPLLIAELQLTRAQIGLLLGFAFVVFYTLMGMVLGTLADRVSRPRLIAAGLALWSLMTGVSGMARSFLHLALPRMLVGVGEATLTPASLSMLADVFPLQRLALATGVYYAGIPLGMALSLLVAGWVAPRYGWRACFYALGVIGLAMSAVLLAVRDPRREETPQAGRASSLAQGPPAAGGVLTLRDILRTLRRTVLEVPSFPLAIAGGACLAYGSAAALHAITWLVQERGYPYATAAFMAAGIAAASGLVGNLAGGWFGDMCQRRTPAGRLWSLILMTLALAPFAVGLYVVEARTVTFYLCWFVASASVTMYFGPLFAVVQEVAPVRIRSTAVAFALLCTNLLGVGPGPWITGIIGDHFSLTRGLLVSIGVACVSVVPFGLAVRRFARDREHVLTL